MDIEEKVWTNLRQDKSRTLDMTQYVYTLDVDKSWTNFRGPTLAKSTPISEKNFGISLSV